MYCVACVSKINFFFFGFLIFPLAILIDWFNRSVENRSKTKFIDPDINKIDQLKNKLASPSLTCFKLWVGVDSICESLFRNQINSQSPFICSYGPESIPLNLLRFPNKSFHFSSQQKSTIICAIKSQNQINLQIWINFNEIVNLVSWKFTIFSANLTHFYSKCEFTLLSWLCVPSTDCLTIFDDSD